MPERDLAVSYLKNVMAGIILGKVDQVDCEDLKFWETVFRGKEDHDQAITKDLLTMAEALRSASAQESKTKPENIQTYLLHRYSHLPDYHPDDDLTKDKSCNLPHCEQSYSSACQEKLTSRLKQGLTLNDLRNQIDIDCFLGTHLAHQHFNQHKFCGHQVNFEHQKAHLIKVRSTIDGC